MSEGSSDEDIVPAGYVVSFRKAFIRLSFTMYLVSDFVIRLDFFSSRLLYSVFVYDTVFTGTDQIHLLIVNSSHRSNGSAIPDSGLFGLASLYTYWSLDLLSL